MKEYNICRHNEAKHLSAHSKYSRKLRSDKFKSMKRSLESQRNSFTKKFVKNESNTGYFGESYHCLKHNLKEETSPIFNAFKSLAQKMRDMLTSSVRKKIIRGLNKPFSQ
ncbi:Hypothetical predicted protein [Octopus vulgaris]|uniref:Uncharacterized protein n=1 Tax=Octopus vulgaris TaxID=6645 RepID=A0AA36EXX9_OCTVU|nr:Hypothetical predicted protein [Octopus vulgaris]